MLERLDGNGTAEAAQLLHDFNREYDEPSPPPAELAARLTQLIEADQIAVLVARADDQPDDRAVADDEPVGVAVVRVQPSIWSEASEVYLAELYVVPARRGQGYGRELVTGVLDLARALGGDYAYVITSEDDELAQRVYEAAGFRRTEGEDGPLMLAYEQDL